MKEKLLFVTRGNDEYEEGFPYAVELSGRIRKDIIMLIMYANPLIKKEKDLIKKTALLTEKYCRNDRSLKISCKTATGDILSSIKEVVESEPAIDMILFGPSLGSKRVINAKNILRNISKPVVFVCRP